MNDIKVLVTRYRDRPNWIMYYLDPVTEKQRSKSSGTPNKREAIKRAGK